VVGAGSSSASDRSDAHDRTGRTVETYIGPGERSAELDMLSVNTGVLSSGATVAGSTPDECREIET